MPATKRGKGGEREMGAGREEKAKGEENERGETKGGERDALSQNPGSERGTTPGSALSIGVGVSSTSLFARRRRLLSLSLLLHYPRLLSSHVLTYPPLPRPPRPLLPLPARACILLPRPHENPPSPSRSAILSTLYFLSVLTVRWIHACLLRLPYARSYNVVLRLYTAAFYSSSSPSLSPLSLSTDYSPLHLARSHQFPYTYPVFLLLLHLPPPRPLDSFPSDAVTGVAPAPNSYKIDGQEPHRERGWWVTPSVGNFSPSQLPRSSARPSIRPSFTHTEVCAYTLCTHARVRAAAWQLDERGGGGGNGAKAKRRRELCSFARTTGRDGEGRWLIRKEREGWRSEEMVRSEERGCEGRGCETETRTRGTNRERERESERNETKRRGREGNGWKRRSVGEREEARRSCARSGGGKDAGAQDAGRRCSTTLHWQLHPSHTRYEPCSRATLHRDTRRTIVASAPTGGTSSSSIFVPVDVRLLGVCLASPRVERN